MARRPSRVWICFEAHRQDGRVWAVKFREQWHLGHTVRTDLPLETVYRGPTGRQPKAYLRGQAQHVQTIGQTIVVR